MLFGEISAEEEAWGMGWKETRSFFFGMVATAWWFQPIQKHYISLHAVNWGNHCTKGLFFLIKKRKNEKQMLKKGKKMEKVGITSHQAVLNGSGTHLLGLR